MLEIVVQENELYNERTNEFIYIDRTVLQLEHSLISLSKWEQKWHKSFLKKVPPKTRDEMVDYIRCMTINSKVSPEVYNYLGKRNMDRIYEYINDSMTATYFPPDRGPASREVITSELIYYWMIECGIPFECQKWHLNRLLALIKVCFRKNSNPGKRNQKDFLRERAELNQARLKKHNTKG